MKILVVSLLRLGDLFMQKALLKSLRQQHPECEIHFLIHREFQKIQSFFPEVRDFHFFERQEWSQWINQAEVPLFKPLKHLGHLIEELNALKFDKVWNWTHQNGSAYLMELIQAREKVGLQSQHGQIRLGSSKALRNFNNSFTNLDNCGPHYIEHLSGIFNLPLPQALRVRESLHEKKENLICLQPLSSDAKKNADLEFFRQWIELHQKDRPQDRILVLGAPQEKFQLESFFSSEIIHIGTLNEVAEILQQADLLISVDTAIKHLAALQGTLILEMAFGSAQPAKTGPWSEKYYFLSPTVSCWPCSHSRPCTQPTRVCAQQLRPADLHASITDLINDQPHPLLKKMKNGNLTLNSSGGTHGERNGKLFVTGP